MQKERFSIKIKAPREKVWKVLWSEESYNKWTSVFGEGSRAVSDWNEGSEIMFLAGNGKGVFSIIDKKVPNEFISFRHLGIVKDDKKVTSSPGSRKGPGNVENYTLKEVGDLTELIVDMDVSDDFHKLFKESFPKALEIVKSLSETPVSVN